MNFFHGSEHPSHPEDESDDPRLDSLAWRRDFLARLIPDLQDRRLRTRDGEADTTEETLQRLRLRLAEIDARLQRGDEEESAV